jgi:hypothetical protein
MAKPVPHMPHEIDPKQYRKGMLPPGYKQPTHGPQLKSSSSRSKRKK